MLFGLMDGVTHYEIDPTKIDLYILHYLKEYDEDSKSFKETKTRHELRPCTSDDFKRDKHEKELWENEKHKHKYCIANPSKISLTGSHKYKFEKETYSYIKIRIDRCTIDCSSEEEIDK